MTEYRNTILVGNATDRLRDIPDGSIDTVVTSPPYWGMRDYEGEMAVVWGGDDDCDHDWEQNKRQHPMHRDNYGNSIQQGNEGTVIEDPIVEWFCSDCDAWKGQLGLEPSIDMFIDHLIEIFREVKRVLKPTGSFWLNVGEKYVRHEDIDPPRKSACMVPERIAWRMVDEEGWILRNKVAWCKSNPFPESVTDRMTQKHEPVFHFVKQQDYYYNLDPMREPGQTTHPLGTNPGDVWNVDTASVDADHFAPFPEELVDRIITLSCPPDVCAHCGSPYQPVLDRDEVDPSMPKATLNKALSWEQECSCSTDETENGVILDPFIGSGTTGKVARQRERDYTGVDLSEEYAAMAERRIKGKKKKKKRNEDGNLADHL